MLVCLPAARVLARGQRFADVQGGRGVCIDVGGWAVEAYLCVLLRGFEFPALARGQRFPDMQVG